MPVPTAHYIAGMRRLAAGVTIVTTGLGELRAGLTATSVCSLTAEPPRLLVCVHRDADTHDIILQSRVFAVNVLMSSQRELADHFGRRDTSPALDKFVLGEWTRGSTGAPVLLGAAANFECGLVEAVEASTHTILIGEIEAARFDEGASALVYHDRTYHRLPG
ncbi:MAG: flavin reductase family protein [Geminicoccaceae bacterium]